MRLSEDERTARVGACEQRVAALPSGPSGAALASTAWWHESRLADGHVVQRIKKLDTLRVEQDAAFGPLDLRGASVLDIGAWTGAFTFEAERRGARRVLAADQFSWMNETFRGLDTFLFLRRDAGSRAEYQALAVDEVTAERVGRFDVVLFLGVFYHLPDPLAPLAELARIADRCLVIETHCDLLDDPLPAMRYYPGDELGGDSTNWWAPNPPCMVGLLKNAGFSRVTATPHPMTGERYFFHAYKD